MAAIIFDFDGTVADSFDYVSNFLAAEAGKAPLSDTQKYYLKGMSMAAMARRLGFSWWRMPRLFFSGRRQMQLAIHNLKPFNGMPELIKKLHAEGHELFIISTNSVRNVHQFLHHHKLHEYFLEIYGGVGMFSKAPALRRLLKEQNIELENAVYIGDEVRDVEAAQSIKLRIVAVMWGFARPESIKELKPTAMVGTVDDLMQVLENI